MLFLNASAEDRWTVVPTYLNVRMEGRYGSRIITSLSRGANVTVLSTLDNGWKHIALASGTTGYVNGKYLANAGPVAESAIGAGSPYVVSVGNAFVRGDDLEKKIAVLKKNDQLESVGDTVYKEKWIRVRIVNSLSGRYDNRIGYISRNLVTAVQEPASTADDWIQDFDVVNMLSVAGSAGAGAGTLATTGDTLSPSRSAVREMDTVALSDSGISAEPTSEVIPR